VKLVIFSFLVKEKNKYKVSACLYDIHYINYKVVPKAATNFFSGFPSLSDSHGSMSPSVLSWIAFNFQDHQRLRECILLSQAAIGKAGTSFLKRVSGRIFTIGK
jgi:hypothetical protein